MSNWGPVPSCHEVLLFCTGSRRAISTRVYWRGNASHSHGVCQATIVAGLFDEEVVPSVGIGQALIGLCQLRLQTEELQSAMLSS